MPRLLDRLPYATQNSIRLARSVELHSMVSSAGRSLERAPAYRWDGQARGARRFVVIQVTLAGCGSITRAGSTIAVPPGSAMIATVPDAHVYEVDTGAGYWDFAYAVLHGGETMRLIDASGASRRPVVRWDTGGRAEAALYELVRTVLSGRRASPYELSGLAYQLVTAILDEEEPGGDDSIARLEEYIAEHLDEPLPIETLAAVAGLSRHHLSRVFSRATGLPPVRYIREARCERAAGYLVTSALSVKEIADRCGFQSSNYFCRVFRETTGLTPQDFRNSRP